MKDKPRFDFIYLLIVIGIIILIVQYDNLTTHSLLTHLAFFDIVLGFVFIIKGFAKWDMSYVFTGAFCALSSYYSFKEMSESALILLILSGILGVGNHVRKTFKSTIG